MTVADRLGRSLFVASAVGLAWGIRGDYGHIIGAMYPGAILGMAWLFVSGSPAILSRMPLISAVMACGIGMGGMMSYGMLHGYAQADSFENYSYGLFTLFLQGGCWGTFGCALAGLLVDRRSMRSGDWLGLVGTVWLSGWLFSFIVVDVIGFHINPPRNDISIAFFGAAIGLFIWLATNNRPIALRAAAFGFIGFGLGMAGGRMLGNATRHIEAFGWTINHWNVMEISCGFIGGGVFTWAMLGLGRLECPEDADETEAVRRPNLLAAFFVIGAIPAMHLLARMPEQYPKWSAQFETYGVSEPAQKANLLLGLLIVVCMLAAKVALLWCMAIRKQWHWPAWFPVVFLSATMLIFQTLTSHFYWYPHRAKYFNMHYVFWTLFSIVALYPLFARGVRRPFETSNAPKTSWVKLFITTATLLAVIIALTAVTNGDRTMSSANTRWPKWSWSEGPFPGKQSK